MMKKAARLAPHAAKSLVTGGVIFVLALIGHFIVSQRVYSEIPSRQLIEAMGPALRTLCFATITAASTITPLMINLIGRAQQADTEFSRAFYAQTELLGILGTIAIILATTLLLLLSIPLTEDIGLGVWFDVTYFINAALSSALAALLISITIILYNTMFGLIVALKPQFDD